MADKTVTVLLRAITGPYQAEMARAATSTAAVGTAAKGTTGQVGGLRGALGPTGAAAAATALKFAGPVGIAAGLGASAKAAIDFESDFAGVRKTVDGSDAQLNNIALGFRNMSTQMPATTTELTAVGEAAGQLGIQTGNILDFTEVMAMMGETTNLTAEEAAVAMARIANVTGMPQTQFKNLASTIVALGNQFAANEQEIVNFMTRLVAAGTQVGFTEADIAGLSAALAAIGVNAEAGGTALSKVMSEIDVAVADGGETLDQFAEIAGMTASQFADAWRRDPADALIAFIEGLGGVEEAGGNAFQVLEELSLNDQRVRAALLGMAGGADQLRAAVAVANDEFREGTALQQEYALFAGTAQAKIDMLGNSVRNLAIETGQGLAPAMGEAASVTSGFLNGVTALMRGLGGKSSGGFWDEVGLGARDTLRAITGINFGQAAFDALTGSIRLSNQELIDGERFAGRYSGSLPDIKEGSEDAAGAIDEYGDAAAGTTDEVAELTDVQKGLQSALQSFADPMATYNKMLEDKQEAERKAAEATAASTKSGKDSWEDYADDVNVSIGDVIKGLRKQIKAQEEWEKNLVTIAKRGGADIAKALAALGPEGADLVAEFAGATDKEFRQAAKLWVQQTDQGGEGVALSLEQKLEKAAGNADKGGKNVSQVLSARVTEMRKGIGAELNKIPEDVEAELIDAKLRGDREAKRAADAISERIGAGRKEVGRQLNMIPPKMREQLGLTRSEADTGGKKTADTLSARVTTGRKDVGKLLNQIPPHMRDSMNNTRDRARTGADNVGESMNRQLAARARKWARIVAGYGDSLAAGLNPVLKALKAGTITSPRDASIRAIERATGAMAEGGIRPDAHITNVQRVIYGEPETGGEAYIPLSPAKRPRSRRIADETVSRLGGQVQWFAKGGFNSTGDVPKVPSGDGTDLGRAATAAMRHTRAEVVEWLKENLAPVLGSGVGYKAMWKAMHTRFPWAQLISGFRPGAITATGNRSYHGMGRAIDVTPSPKIAQWIRDNYMGKTREMIYSPFGSRQIWNGRNHYYTGITRAMHFDHVHWAMKAGGILGDQVARRLDEKGFGAPKGAGADLDLFPMPVHSYDQGGMLPQGLSMAYNGTGAPEPVGPSNVNVQVFVGDREITDIVDVRLDYRDRRAGHRARQGQGASR